MTPNTALAEGSLDANFFQHVPHLENTNKEKAGSCMGRKVTSTSRSLFEQDQEAERAENGAQIAIPNDATNCARALRLLEKNGLIKVKAESL